MGKFDGLWGKYGVNEAHDGFGFVISEALNEESEAQAAVSRALLVEERDA